MMLPDLKLQYELHYDFTAYPVGIAGTVRSAAVEDLVAEILHLKDRFIGTAFGLLRDAG